MTHTRKTVSSEYPNPEEWVEKLDAAEFFFNPLQGVWRPDETLCRVFDIASKTDH